MRLAIALLTAACLVMSACATRPNLAHALTTDSGALIRLTKCSTGTQRGDDTYQFFNITLIVGGKQRIDPKFDFSKNSIEYDDARGAAGTIESLGKRFRWACGEMSKEARLGGHIPVTPRDEYLLRFHDEAMRATIDIALRFERETTHEGYRKIFSDSQALLKSFRDREPDSWEG